MTKYIDKIISVRYSLLGVLPEVECYDVDEARRLRGAIALLREITNHLQRKARK